MAAASSSSAQPNREVLAQAVRNNDAGVEYYLKAQTTDPKHRWFGGFPDAYGLHHGGTVMACFDVLATSFLHPRSKHYQSKTVWECMQRAGTFLNNHTSPDGNVHLLSTNFNSTPDTAFGARGMACAARVSQILPNREVFEFLRPHLERAGRALVKGGLHTPNHRWIHCSSLAQIHEVLPDPAYGKRIDQWLAEGIDIDEDGQYTERSTGTYNMVVNSSLMLLADKLKRWELLEPVRRNLDAVIHLMHANGELVTDISSRQDRGSVTTIAPYFLVLQYLAIRDRNPVFAALAAPHRKDYLQLSYLLQWPELGRTDLPQAPVPGDYTRHFPRMGVTRVRRGLTSATIFSRQNSRFFQLRHGDAVIESVRFASGFFGKGQFRPAKWQAEGNRYTLTQQLRGPYYQPLERSVGMEFEELRKLRKQTEVCELTQSAQIVETAEGFDLQIEVTGTDDVPVTVEINCRALTFGPGRFEHTWIDVRGAEPRTVSGTSVYLSGYTPFRHTLKFRRSG